MTRADTSAKARAAAAGAAVAFAVVAGVAAIAAGSNSDHGARLTMFVNTLVWLGGPYALAGLIVGWHLRRAATGPDRAARLVRVAAAGEWGAAMRAELASIEDPGERRRFALGCVRASLATGLGRAPVMLAIGTAIAFAAATFTLSRASLAGDQAGALGPMIAVTPLALLGAGLIGGIVRRGFRGGLVFAAVVAVAAFVGIVAVGLPESRLWAEQAGVYILDGDAPRPGTEFSPLADVLTSSLFFAGLFWTPAPVIGAGLGAALSRRRRTSTR